VLFHLFDVHGFSPQLNHQNGPKGPLKLINFLGVALVSLGHVPVHRCGVDGVLIASPWPPRVLGSSSCERLGLAVIRAYDLGLLARALSTGRRYVGVVSGWVLLRAGR
jgi:hypothetical protein